MSLANAYLIKGFVLAHNPPKEVLDAIEAVIAHLVAEPSREVDVAGDVSLTLVPTPVPCRSEQPEATEASAPESVPEHPPQRKTRGWSPEQRAAASERMRERQAAGLMGRKNKDSSSAAVSQTPSAPSKTANPVVPAEDAAEPDLPDFDESELRITLPSPSPTKPRKSQLSDEDWPEIKEMLAAGRDRKAIASDYDEDVEDLDFFIAWNQRREAKQPPGEAGASPSGVASDAMRQTW